jgi:excisionase family DNA binding protein
MPSNSMDSELGARRPTHHEITADVQRRTVTVEEAAQQLGIGRNSAYSAVKRGEIPAISIGRRLVVPVDRLERLLAGEPSDAA